MKPPTTSKGFALALNTGKLDWSAETVTVGSIVVHIDGEASGYLAAATDGLDAAEIGEDGPATMSEDDVVADHDLSMGAAHNGREWQPVDDAILATAREGRLRHVRA